MLAFTLRQLEVFISITQARSLSAAATKLCLSKAAVSLSLAELENQLGHSLFDRIKNRLVLNNEGKLLLPAANELLDRARELPQLFNQGSQLTGKIHLGASNTIGNQLLPLLVRDFTAKHPNIEFDMQLSNSSALVQQVSEFGLDCALIESNEVSPQLNHHSFGYDNMCIVCAPSHPLLNNKNLYLHDLESQSWLLREPGSGSRDFFITHIATQLKSWNKAFELTSSEAIINSVGVGLGLACLSELSVATAIQAGKVAKLAIQLPLARKMQLVVHNKKHLNPQLKAFIDFSLAWRLSNHLAKSATELDCKQ
ncbi:LysR substrate-binding domain-containing protein [Vibrio gallicus]|uniref:LysR substrate-binding domain-containing protein n=1 Tax=Vibrio gallicus TaxID=190897 RepID=UPI0021C2C309|nr:LysR substrate-binding domain-containing protein [Vibrio gallicus]